MTTPKKNYQRICHRERLFRIDLGKYLDVSLIRKRKVIMVPAAIYGCGENKMKRVMLLLLYQNHSF